jgi:hypothetical protein
MVFQNHLYGCFIVMEDIAQGVLDVSDGYLTGNALYLNLDTQFGHIGIRYYGFIMDGKAVLDVSDEYKDAWAEVFRACKGSDITDLIEEEVVRLVEDVKEDNFFMNAMEHDGSLTPDWIEKALYTLHPQLEVKAEKPKAERSRARSLALTRRQHRVSSRTHWATTRRQPVSRK